MDSLFLKQERMLAQTSTDIVLQGGKHLFLDEVHKYPTWSKELKEVYDLYPSLHIVFSGSSLLNILNADADLSRRCLPYSMHGLSFREFLMFYKDIRIPAVSLPEVLENAGSICQNINALCRPVQMFNEYLYNGYYPFFTGNREDYYMNIENVVNFILEQEMPLLCVKKMQKPDKIYLQNPNLLYAIASTSAQIGTARETFVLSQLSVNHEIEYGKTQGDFVVDHTYTFEVGGADKPFKQIADLPNSFILADNIEYATGKKRPLWIVGLIY